MVEAQRHVVISGCSGGGKSTLIAELAARGYRTIEEPARQLLQDQSKDEKNPEAFTAALVQRYVSDRAAAEGVAGLVFFDRSLLDVMSWYHRNGVTVPFPLLEHMQRGPYHRQVFLVPPWPEIFENDAERTHDFADVVAEFEWLPRTYALYGYDVIEIPRTPVAERAEFVLSVLGEPEGDGSRPPDAEV